MEKRDKRGQIWIETVIYTLIAFILIGSVLAFVKPKIEEMQDKAIVEQSIELMKSIDRTITTMNVAGNRRVLSMQIKNGNLIIDGIEDKLQFEVEGRYAFSEYGKEINDENLIITTEKLGDNNLIKIKRDYSSLYNVTFSGTDSIKTITKGSTSYNLIITNKGKVNNNWTMDFEIG